MLFDQILIAGIGLGTGVIVNALANWLPTFSPTYQERKGIAEAEDKIYGPSPQALRIRYIAVAVFLIAIALYLWTRDQPPITVGAVLAYIAIFVLVTVIDIEFLIVPDALIIPAFIIALVEIAFTRRIGFVDALAGYAAAQIILSVIYVGARLYLALINRRRTEEDKISAVPFGFGDVTLATFCGLVVGLSNVILLVVLMILLGAITAILMTFVRLIAYRSMKAHGIIPYGPSIVLSAALILIWGRSVAALVFGGN